METQDDYRFPGEMATEVRLDMVVGQHVIHVPAEVRVSRPGMIEWRLPMRSVAPKKNIAANFVALGKASDEEIAEFVRTYGFIGADTLPVLTPGSKPYQALPLGYTAVDLMGRTVDSEEWTKGITEYFNPTVHTAVPVLYEEPTAIYRKFAQRASAVLQVAKSLQDGLDSPYSDLSMALSWPRVAPRSQNPPSFLGALIHQSHENFDDNARPPDWLEYEFKRDPTFAAHDVLGRALDTWIKISTRVGLRRQGQVSISSSVALHPDTTKYLISDHARTDEMCGCQVPCTEIEAQILHRFSCLLPVGLAVVNALYDPIPRCSRCSRAFVTPGRKIRDDRRKFCSTKCREEQHRETMRDNKRKERSQKKEAPSE